MTVEEHVESFAHQELIDILSNGEKDFQEGRITDSASVYDRIDRTLISAVKNGLFYSKASNTERCIKRSFTLWKITLYDMNCSPVSDGVAIFFTEDINHFEQNWAPLCIKIGDNERVERFRRSKNGELVTDYYGDDSELNIVQEDPDAEMLHEKQFTLRDVTFFATNTYGWHQQYHIDNWYCVFRWIRFRKDFFCVFQYKASGVCRIDGERLRDVNCYGNPVLINTKEFAVKYSQGVPIIEHPLSYSDFAENSIETFCWLTSKSFKTRGEAESDFNSFEVTEDDMDRMFCDVIGEAG